MIFSPLAARSRPDGSASRAARARRAKTGGLPGPACGDGRSPLPFAGRPAAADFKAESPEGLPAGVSAPPGACGCPARIRHRFGALGLKAASGARPPGGATAALGGRGKPPQRSEASGRGGARRDATRRRFDRNSILDTGTRVQSFRARRAGGSFVIGPSLCPGTTRATPEPARFPESFETNATGRRQGHNAGPLTFLAKRQRGASSRRGRSDASPRALPAPAPSAAPLADLPSVAHNSDRLMSKIAPDKRARRVQAGPRAILGIRRIVRHGRPPIPKGAQRTGRGREERPIGTGASDGAPPAFLAGGVTERLECVGPRRPVCPGCRRSLLSKEVLA